MKNHHPYNVSLYLSIIIIIVKGGCLLLQSGREISKSKRSRKWTKAWCTFHCHSKVCIYIYTLYSPPRALRPKTSWTHPQGLNVSYAQETKKIGVNFSKWILFHVRQCLLALYQSFIVSGPKKNVQMCENGCFNGEINF